MDRGRRPPPTLNLSIPPRILPSAPRARPEASSGFQLRLRLRFNRAGRPVAIMIKRVAGSGATAGAEASPVRAVLLEYR